MDLTGPVAANMDLKYPFVKSRAVQDKGPAGRPPGLSVNDTSIKLAKNGRDDWIRTSDPLTPSQVRYQAALHPERTTANGGRVWKASASTTAAAAPRDGIPHWSRASARAWRPAPAATAAPDRCAPARRA